MPTGRPFARSISSGRSEATSSDSEDSEDRTGGCYVLFGRVQWRAAERRVLGDELRRDSPRPAADQPPVDLSVALRQAGGSPSLLIELVGIFQDDLPERLDRLQNAIHAGD